MAVRLGAAVPAVEQWMTGRCQLGILVASLGVTLLVYGLWLVVESIAGKARNAQ